MQSELKTVAPADAEHQNDFEAFFHQHYGKLVGMLHRLLGQRMQAEEIALETFLRFWQKKIPPGESTGAWLYKVALRLGYNGIRSRKRREKYEQTPEPSHLYLVTPESEMLREQENRRVRETLAEMKPLHSQILLLRYSDLSYSEIASTLNIAPGSVGATLLRAEREFEKLYVGGK